MSDAEPGLFEWTTDTKPKTPPRRPQRGRNRETWELTTTAEVVIADAVAVKHALAKVEANAVMLGPIADLDAEDPAWQDCRPGPGALDHLSWLIWPTDGQEALTEADALRVLIVDCEVVAETDERGTATWTVTATLNNVDWLRQLATQGHPDEAADIEDSFPIAWQRAADPFAPLHSIPGITWEPKSVEVKHVPARDVYKPRK